MALTWLADALRDAGLVVHELPGWTERGRPGEFAPRGVLLRHTAAFATPADPHPSLDDAAAGRDGGPGPRCHVLVDRNGECWVVAAGRAEHAGHAAASGPMPSGDGDALYVGVGVEYAATTREPTQHATSGQRSTAVLAAARIVGRLGGDHRHVRAQRETGATIANDPYNWDMVAVRDAIRQTLERTGW